MQVEGAIEVVQAPDTVGNVNRARTATVADGEEERGYLDHLVDVNEGYARAGEVSEELAEVFGNPNRRYRKSDRRN